MASGEHALTVVVAVIGMVATGISGVVGYQTGTNAVNKDYVSLAISTIDKKDASPELRKWAVDVLNTLSPVPFGAKLKKELTTGTPLVTTYAMRMNPPGVLMHECPDVLKGSGKEVSDDLAFKVVNQYDVCRIKVQEFISWVNAVNKIIDKANADSDAAYEQATGEKPPPRPGASPPKK
jgi:hypothetical protein